MHVADQEVKRLEYWSDIRGIVREGHTQGAADGSKNWPTEEWQGLDASGPLANEQPEAKEKGKSKQEIRQDSDLYDEPAPAGSGEVFRDSEEEHEYHDHSAAAVHSSDAYETAEETADSADKGNGQAL